MGILETLDTPDQPAFATPATQLQKQQEKKKLPGLVKGAIQALPSIEGGIAGSLTAPLKLTGPAGMAASTAAAGVGGAQGEVHRQLATAALNRLGFDAGEEPATVQDALGKVGNEAMVNAALELGGGAAVRGAKFIGKTFMRGAIKASPEIIQTAIRERIPATKAGFDKLMNKLGELGMEARNKAARAGFKGVRWHPQHDIADPAFAKAELALEHSSDHAGDVAKLEQLRRKYLVVAGPAGSKRQPPRLRPPINPVMAIGDRQKADAVADPIYEAMAKKEPTTNNQTVLAAWNKALADTYRAKLNNIPGFQEVSMRESELIKLKNAVWPEIKEKRSGFAQAVGRQSVGAAIGSTAGALGGENAPGGRFGGAAAGAVIGSYAARPGVLSNLGMLATNPALLAMLQKLGFAGRGLDQASQ